MVSDAAADFHFQSGFCCHIFVDMLIHWSALFSAVQIYHVNPGCAGSFKTFGSFHVICCDFFHGGEIAFEQADAVTVFNINCR